MVKFICTGAFYVNLLNDWDLILCKEIRFTWFVLSANFMRVLTFVPK